MKILVLGLNYAPEKIGIAVYTTGMAEALVAAGHDVRVVAGQPYYPGWRTMPGHKSWGFSQGVERGVRVTRVPHYVPNPRSGVQRLVQQASFAMAAFVPALWNAVAWRPDLVLAVAPALIAAPVARIAAFVAGAMSWLHIQDFEVEAAFATRLLKRAEWLARIAHAFEAAVLGSFERVSAISPQMCRRLLDKGVPVGRIEEVRNWSDIHAVRPLAGPSPYRERWGITTPHVALYSGNIAHKQGAEIAIEAARRLAGREDLTFVICGEGSNREQLKQLAGGLGNVQFHDLQPKERLSELMGLATIHLLPQIAEVADWVLPSKLANMLASGRPVVATAAAGTELAREVDQCGAVVPPGDGAAFAEAIETLLDDEERWSAAACMARSRAEERWGKIAVLGGFIAALERLVEGPGPVSLEADASR